jgi:hypothetical protein
MKASKMTWAGRIMSVLVVLPFLPSAFMKISGGEEVLKGMAQFGIPATLLVPLAIVELTCVALYLIPYTAVIGAILLTGYLGGAMLTHLRVGDGVYLHITLGILAWGGLFLRDSRVRELIPLRKF